MVNNLWFKVNHYEEEWRWRLFDQDGRELARSRFYTSRAEVLESIDVILEIEQATMVDENRKVSRRGK